MGNEGQQQVVARLKNEVEDLLSEVFERLPQTVDGFQEGGIEHSGMDVSQSGHSTGGGRCGENSCCFFCIGQDIVPLLLFFLS